MLTASEQLQAAAWKVKFCLICHNTHRQLDKHCCISYFAWGLPACQKDLDFHSGGLYQSNTTLPEIRSLTKLASLSLRAKRRKYTELPLLSSFRAHKWRRVCKWKAPGLCSGRARMPVHRSALCWYFSARWQSHTIEQKMSNGVVMGLSSPKAYW